MDRARIHEGIRRMRFTDILGRSERSELSQMEAAELLGITERQRVGARINRWLSFPSPLGISGSERRPACRDLSSG